MAAMEATACTWSGVPTVTASMFFASFSSISRKSLYRRALGKAFERARRALLVHVAQGHDVAPQPADCGDVAAPHATGADATHVDPVARGCLARPAQHVPR